MSTSSRVSDLFEEKIFPSASPDEILGLLRNYGIRGLAYAGDAGRNPGYVFRGELASFPVPLPTTLERHWFDENRSADTCVADKLLLFENRIVEDFVRDASEIADIAKEHGQSLNRPADTDVFEWLSLIQHYRRRTRLLDFTRDIRFAMYFACEHFCQKCNATYRNSGLVIYCFPCKNCRWPRDDNINKCPFRHEHGPIDMNLAIGGQIGLNCMKPHLDAFEKRYCGAKQVQSFGWDRAFNPNPRLSFQKGMLVYPFKTQDVLIKRNDGPSWLEQCLRMNRGDPFHLGPAKGEVPPLMIRIPQESVMALIDHVQDVFGLTPRKVYLDYGRIGDRLHIEETGRSIDQSCNDPNS